MCEINFDGLSDPQIGPGKDYSQKSCTGNLQKCFLEKASFSDSFLFDLNAMKADFTKCDFTNVKLKNVNFCGAKLNNIRNFDTVDFLGGNLFDDDTEVDGIDLVRLASRYPLIASRLRQHRYLGKFKEKRPTTYKLWQFTCRCGRSWGRFLSISVIVVILFACLFFIGSNTERFFVLPHIDNSGSGLGVISSIQFSALTFTGSNMADVTWSGIWTGFWIITEALIGIVFLGILITIIATNISRNE